MNICYEAEHASLKAIGFTGFIKATLECIENGSLTIVVQDNHAIQVNRCEQYTLGEYNEEEFPEIIDSFKEVLEA